MIPVKGQHTNMNQTPQIRLAELAFACRVYEGMSGYDKSYYRFLDGTKPLLDLQKEQHMEALLKWLNDWGCRQFAKDDHPLAAREISDWHTEVAFRLFPIDKDILALSEGDLAVVERAYAGLTDRTASMRRRLVSAEGPVKIGPTGASKILFALRPEALIPWDEFMRKRSECDGTARSYTAFLRGVRAQLQGLNAECAIHGFQVQDLPQVLGRRGCTLPKLIDEFHWVTISRGCPVPAKEELKRWASWLP
jgi:hypothetical protein